MVTKDKVKVEICGRSFFLTSADDPEYLIKIADKIDKDILKLMKKNIGVTFDQAAILVASYSGVARTESFAPPSLVSRRVAAMQTP